MVFKGLESSQVFKMADIVPNRRSQIISHNLVMNNRCDIRIFSFSEGEEVGIQITKADIMYWVQYGCATIKEEASKTSLSAGEMIIMSSNKAHGITADSDAKIFQISLHERNSKMDKFIKNIDHRKVLKMEEVLAYESNKVASMTLAQNDKLSLTLMSFDKGEGISTHAASGDAMVQVLDGTVEITIDGETHHLNKGESIIMPANIPHALKAIEKFKMFLIVVK